MVVIFANIWASVLWFLYIGIFSIFSVHFHTIFPYSVRPYSVNVPKHGLWNYSLCMVIHSDVFLYLTPLQPTIRAMLFVCGLRVKIIRTVLQWCFYRGSGGHSPPQNLGWPPSWPPTFHFQTLHVQNCDN